MEKRTINLIIGIVLATLAILMIHNYIREQREVIARLVREGEAVEVVVAARNIPEEATITSDMVRTRVVHRDTVQPGDLTSMDSAINQFTIEEILKDQHINRSMLRPIGVARYLSHAIPSGMRAMTIPVDKISALEGLVKPGDRVDVLGTFNVPVAEGHSEPIVVSLFKNIRVLAVNRIISTYQVPGSADTVTLALKPDDIEIFDYALKWGDMRLVLRPPEDRDTDYGYQAVTFQTLMRRLGMYQPEAPSPAPATVDVYRGPDREEAPIR